MNTHDLIEYAPAHCDRCDKEMTDFCCDDVCVECEAEFLRSNPDEIPFLLSQIKRYPVQFAPWQKAINLLGDELELLTLIGQCQCGDRVVDKTSITNLLRLASSLGKFQGTNDTIAAFVKQRKAA
jgi:hypothetical protein